MDNTKSIQVSLTGMGDIPQDLADQINGMEGGRAMVTERSNLSGAASEWMMVASIGMTLLPHIVEVLKAYLSSRQPDRDIIVEMAGIKATNPPPQVLEEMLRKSREGE